MEELKEIEEMNQTQQPPWLVNNILFGYEGETQRMTMRESSISCSTEENTVITWKPTLTDQRAQEGK